MIILTDTDAAAFDDFDGLDNAPPVPSIDLSATEINANITGSVIAGDATVTTAVRTMLLSIIDNTNVTLTAKSNIAKYAGFTVNNTVNPSTIIFTAANVSLDKLTFYIIFRLPYTGTGLTYEDIGNGLISSTLPASPTTWGKYANYIRDQAASGIKKINSAGEQVSVAGVPVNNAGTSLDGWYSEIAYTFLGVTPFSGSYTIPAGCLPASVEKLMLFGQNNSTGPNGADPILDITKIPLYFYLLAEIENPYNNAFWLQSSKDDKRISRVPHWPASVSIQNYRKHFVKTTSTLTIPEGTYTLLSEGTNIYFNLHQPSPAPDVKIYITAISADTLTYEGLTLSGADKVQKTSQGLIAIWEDKFSDPKMGNSSGLTVGMGLDMGATFNGVFRIEFEITFSGSGKFRLYYADKRSAEINTVGLTCASLKTTLQSLVGIDPIKITVTNSTGGSSGVPNKIKIVRSNDGNDNAYNHKIYAYDETAGLTVTFNPSTESARWMEIAAQINDGWFYLNRVLNYSFSNQPTGDDYWLDQLSLTAAEKDKMKFLLKKAMGCRSKTGYANWIENKAFLQKLELKSYVRNLRAVFHKFFLEKFYNTTRTTANGSPLDNADNTTIQHLLDKTALKTKPNQAELFAIVLYNYNYPGAYKTQKVRDQLIKAINRHSKVELMNAMELKNGKGNFYMDSGRRTGMTNFLAKSQVTNHLYHGLSD